MIVADVKAIFVRVIGANDAGAEVVAAGWGDYCAGCVCGRGVGKSEG